MSDKMEYPFSIKIRNNEINFRKWKVKDKKNFIEAVKNNDAEGIQHLIYDCLEKPNIALTQDEFKYVLLNIRSQSLGEDLTFDFTCVQCEKDFMFDAKILDIMKPDAHKFGRIKSGSTSIKIGEIANREFYEDSLAQCNSEEERYLVDFIYHIKEFNGNDGFTFEQAFDFVNNLDLDIGEDILSQWEAMRFKINDVSEVTCPHCKHTQKVQYDELYGFFPDSWFE